MGTGTTCMVDRPYATTNAHRRLSTFALCWFKLLGALQLSMVPINQFLPGLTNLSRNKECLLATY